MQSRNDLHKIAAALGGLLVVGCMAGSSAKRAGVAYGDILLSVNGLPTPDWASYIDARDLSPTTMVCEVFRDGVIREVVLERDATKRDMGHLLAEIIAERLVPLDSPWQKAAATESN